MDEVKFGAERPSIDLESVDARAREQAAATWAAELLGALVGTRARSFGLFPSEAERAASTSNSGAVRPDSSEIRASETEASAEAEASQSADTSGVNDDAPDRLTLELVTTELGALSLVLERTDSGVSVLIAGDAAARNALGADRQALIAALGGSGSKVCSVRILPREDVGIVLAQGVTSRRERSSVSPHSPPDARRQAPPGRRRLNLIG